MQKDSKKKRSAAERLNWGSGALAVEEDGDGGAVGTQSHVLLWRLALPAHVGGNSGGNRRPRI